MTDNNTNRNKAICSVCQTAHDTATACQAVNSTPAGPLLAQAESLFESYLAARLARARRSLTSAKVALLRDPRSSEKREALLRAESETQKLEAQLLEQARRAATAREQASANSAAPSTEPTPDFRALQAAKAEITVGANPDAARRRQSGERECPRCSSHVPSASEFCGCGYRFTPEIAAETFLSEEELVALRTAKARE